jgi:HEAT repeat protein
MRWQEMRYIFFFTSLLLVLSSTILPCCNSAKVMNEDQLSELVVTMISGTNIDDQRNAGSIVHRHLSTEEGLDAILDLLNSKNPWVRRDTLVVIGSAYISGRLSAIHNDVIIPLLLKSLKDSKSIVRERAVSTIGDIIMAGTLSGINNPINGYTNEVISAVTLLLNDPNSDVQVKACNTLAYLGPSATTKPRLGDISQT